MNEISEFDLRLARFVDGELSAIEEDQLLLQCEQRPELYRDLALALVEERRWGMQLAGGEVPTVLPVAKTVEEAPAAGRRWWSVGLAASLLFGTCVGYWFARPLQSGSQENEGLFVQQNGDDRSLDLRQPPDLQQQQPTSLPDQSNVPTQLVDYSGDQQLARLVRELSPGPAFSEDGMRQLVDEGVSVDQQSAIYVLEMSDGRRLAVPTQFIKFRAK